MQNQPATRDDDKRVVIQNRRSKLFLRCDGNPQWTEKFDEATRFPSTAQAAMQCVRLRLDEVQVVLTFGAKRYDLILPMNDSNRSRGNTPPR